MMAVKYKERWVTTLKNQTFDWYARHRHFGFQRSLGFRRIFFWFPKNPFWFPNNFLTNIDSQPADGSFLGCKTSKLQTCMYMYACTYIYIYIRMYIYIYTYMYIYIHIHVYVYMYMYIYTYTYTYICIYVYIHTHTRICIYIHTRICIHIWHM